MVSPISEPSAPETTTAMFLLGSGIGSVGSAPKYAGAASGSAWFPGPRDLYQKLAAQTVLGTSTTAATYATARNTLRHGMRGAATGRVPAAVWWCAAPLA